MALLNSAKPTGEVWVLRARNINLLEKVNGLKNEQV